MSCAVALTACGGGGSDDPDPDAGPDGQPDAGPDAMPAPPPETVIDTRPAELSASAAAVITFSSPTRPPSGLVLAFECADDGALGFSPCTSPVTRTGLSSGMYSLAVRARWVGGAADATPERASWTVDRTPAETTITAGPAGNTAPGAASFTFSSEAGATFECRLDAAAFAPCTSPLAMQVALGDHTFEVRATDALGNADPTPAQRPYRGDLNLLPAPETTIVTRPNDLSANGTAIVTFMSAATPPAGVTLGFECAADGATVFAGCTSPVTRTGLGTGSYSLAVRARWVGGLADATPAVASWTIDRTPAETTITGGPLGDTEPGAAMFTFTSEANATFECSLDGGAYAACTSPVPVDVTLGDHSFAVRAKDALGNVDPSPAARSYRGVVVVIDPPETVILTQPAALSASATATVTFTSPTTPPAGLTLGFECAADGSTAFAACTSPVTRTGLGSGSYSLAVRARWLGSSIDATPAVASWTIDRTAPETTITGGPMGDTTPGPALFTFTSEAGATFECRVDAAAFAACTSPAAVQVTAGDHTFEVRAADALGNVDATPAARAYRGVVDTTPPETTITSGPMGDTTPGPALFTFTSEAGATFECRVDAAAFAACTSPATVQVTAGDHTFEVRAQDAAGNVDPTPAARSYRGVVVIDPPETVILTQPAPLSASATATVTFTSPTTPPAGLTLGFECAADGSAVFSACTSPVTRTGLGSGSYSLAVRARWLGSSIDPTPAMASWTIDRTAPETTITSGPMGDTGIGTAMFTFTSEAGATFECRLDAAAFAACTSPATVQVTAGDHTFEVRAADALGNVDATPAARAYRGVAAQLTRLRLMAANITSGNGQSYDPGHGTRIFQGVKPDIVMIQEFNYKPGNTDVEIRAWVTQAFGASFQYFREPGKNIPNGIISRYPILAAGVWEDQAPDRELVWARIDVPGPKDLWAISVHLLTANASTRNSQATALRDLINANIPAGDFLVIGGDFNTDNRSEPCVSTLAAVTSNGAPYPMDQAGNGNTNASRGKPYDWVMMDDDLRAFQVPLVIGASTYPSGLVFDSRVYTPLAEVAPVLATDSGATNMQHMGVAVDVMLPN